MRSQRWSVIVAHRRAGKTVASINDTLTRALACPKQHPRYGYIAPYYRQAKGIAWDYLKRYSACLSPKVNEAELSVEFDNAEGQRARVTLYGADNPDSLRGLYFDGVVLDEPADMRPRLFPEIIRPALADRRGWAAFIGTPKGHNAFYDLHRMAANEPSWFSMVLRASASGLLTAEEIEDMRKTMTDDQADQELECSFEAAIIGAIYGRQMAEIETRGRMVKKLYDPKLPVHTAWDLGLSDATAIWFFQAAHMENRVIDYLEGHHEKVSDYVDALKERGYSYGKHFLPHDGNNKLLAAGGRSIVQQLWEHKIKAQVVPATTQVNQIAATRKVLDYTWFDPVLCDDGIEALKQYRYKFDEDRKVYLTQPLHDWTSHAADAFEILSQVWQSPKELEPEEKPRYLHEMTANDVFWPKNQPKSVRTDRI